MQARAAIAVLAVTASLLLPASEHAGARPQDQAPLGPAEFESVLPPAPGATKVALKKFRLDRTPVTNAKFLAFVRAHPKWRRGRVPRLFAGPAYLAHWNGALELGPGAKPGQPVTNVSWFAAKAYCEARGARLPTWHEWEFAAAANERTQDARGDPQWRQRVLVSHAAPGSELAQVGLGRANFHGIHDLHGLVWEWVLDYGALLVSADSREQDGADRARFCGEGALGALSREHYAVLMRIAVLSALEASGTTANLGFRCARDDAP